MDDLATQIRAWADAAADSTSDPVSAGEVLRGDHRPQPTPAPSMTGAGSARRLALGVAAVLILVAGIAAIIARSHKDNSTTLSTKRPATTGRTNKSQPTGTKDQITFHVLGIHPATHDRMGTLQSATAQQELPGLWANAGQSPPIPTIDFHKQVIVIITIPDDACPPTLAGFDRSGTTLQPRFIEPPGGCIKPLIPKTYVAALDWSATGPAFRLRLPGQPIYGFNDTFLDIRLPKSSEPSPGPRLPAGMNSTHTAIPAGNGIGYVDLTAITDHPGVPLSEWHYPHNLPGYRVTDRAGKVIGYYRAINDGTDKCANRSPTCGHYVFVDLDGKVPPAPVP